MPMLLTAHRPLTLHNSRPFLSLREPVSSAAVSSRRSSAWIPGAVGFRHRGAQEGGLGSNSGVRVWNSRRKYIALAARIADVVLLTVQGDRNPAGARESVREQARAAGRDADEIAVLLDVPVDGSPGAADRFRALFDAGAADGFTLLAPAGPAGASHEAVLALAAEVRGAGGGKPSAPAGATLRERLGLPRPAGRHQTA